MTSLQAYPEYKDSGLPWVGEIPAHWELLPNRGLFEFRKETVGDRWAEFDLLSLTKRGVVLRDMVNPQGKFPDSFDNYQVIEAGDFVFCLFDIDETPRAVGLSSLGGMITGAYTRFASRRPALSAFLYYFYLSLDNQKSLKPLYTGLRKVIQKGRFLSVKTPVPPLQEHEAIVRYLHAMDLKIAHFIRNRRRLIEVLNEQKQAIINRAVTRGLDPDVPLKPSGIDWLGDIPKHWEVMPIKRMFSHTDYGVSESARDKGRYQVLTMGNIQNGKVIFNNCGRVDQVDSQLILDHHDLLYNRTNSLELVAKVGLFEGVREDDITFASYLVRMKTNNSTLPKYANYLLNSSSVLAFARLNAIPSLHQANLNPNRYGRLPVPLPPISEQALILYFITENCEGIEKVLKQTQREIDLIREYRTRLIADVVTGKVDVRHLVPPPGSEGAEAAAEGFEPLDEEPGELDEITIEEGGLDETH